MSALVKICGVRSPAIARLVAEVQADLMGLIFAPSRRIVSVDEARVIAQAAREWEGDGESPRIVGVFVNESPERMNEIAGIVGLDALQLSGDEPPEQLAALDRPVIKVLRLPFGTAFAEAAREAERYLNAATPARALMLDTHVSGSYGGSGRTGDWDLAARLAERYPVLLAGGLDPANVGAALTAARPLGVDVSSGVETEGAKDPAKIRRFVAEVRQHDALTAHQSPSLRADDLLRGSRVGAPARPC